MRPACCVQAQQYRPERTLKHSYRRLSSPSSSSQLVHGAHLVHTSQPREISAHLKAPFTTRGAASHRAWSDVQLGYAVEAKLRDGKGPFTRLIKSDFVLVPGDVVANIALAPLIAAHKARREVDREAVLTTVMSRVPVGHQARRGGAHTGRRRSAGSGTC